MFYFLLGFLIAKKFLSATVIVEEGRVCLKIFCL